MADRRTSRPQNNSVQAIQDSLTSGGLKKLSELRRSQIQDAQIKKDIAEEEAKPGAAIIHSHAYKTALIKKATVGPAALPTTRGLTDMMGPEVYSPLFQLANLNLPRDRVTMNAWNRIFYDTHPIVRNAINLHASYPISKINISHPVKEIQEFFLEMAERIDLYSVVYGVALEYFKLGEVFPYAELDREIGSWKRITILNPDYVHVKKTAIGEQVIVSLRPDATLQRLVNSNSPSDIALKRRLPQHIIDAVKKGQTIPLDNINVSHLKLLSSPYDVRGTSIIVSVYKDLMLYDKLRESKFAQADGMINPLTLVKLGNGEYRPTQSDIEAMRIALEEAQYDKDFKIVTHDGVTIDRVGYSGGVLEIGTDVEHILANLYTGLMVPKALMDQEGATYASSSVGLEVLRQRYDIFRNMIKKWLEQKVFAPISELQDFFVYKGGKKVLQVPVVDFNHMNLYDMNDYVQNIANLVGNKQISVHTLYRSLGLSYDEERRRLKEEAIHETIKMKQQEALGTMRLRELEGLDADSVIQEPAEAVPGGVAGAAPPGGLPGMAPPGGPPGGPGAPPGMGGPPAPGGPPV
jgi:hypothetical protein